MPRALLDAEADAAARVCLAAALDDLRVVTLALVLLPNDSPWRAYAEAARADICRELALLCDGCRCEDDR